MPGVIAEVVGVITAITNLVLALSKADWRSSGKLTLAANTTTGHAATPKGLEDAP